jgi:hypothetical protein
MRFFKSEFRCVTRVHHPCSRQRISPLKLFEPLPRHRVAPTPPTEPLPPDLLHVVEKPVEALKITRHSVVRMAPHEFFGKSFLLLANRRMPISLAPPGYSLQSPREAPLLGLPLNHPMEGRCPTAGTRKTNPRPPNAPQLFHF